MRAQYVTGNKPGRIEGGSFRWVIMSDLSMNALWPLLMASLIVSPAPIFAQSRPQQVLALAVESLGGRAFLEAREIENRGRFFQFSRGQLASGGAFVDYIKFPDKERTEFGKNGRSVLINNGDQGWVVEDKEVKPQSPAQVEAFQREFKSSFDYLFRFVLNDPKTTIQYLGTEIIEFSRADVVEIRDANKNRITLYINRQTHLPMKKQVRTLDKPEVREEIYSNYHRIQHVVTPLFVARYTDGLKTMEIRLESVTYNPGLSETLFTSSLSK